MSKLGDEGRECDQFRLECAKLPWGQPAEMYHRKCCMSLLLMREVWDLYPQHRVGTHPSTSHG